MITPRRIHAPLILSVLLLASASVAWARHWSADEFDVYDTVIREKFSGDDISYFLILNITQPLNRFGISIFHAKQLGLPPSARVSYFAKNLFRFQIPGRLRLPHPFAMVDQKEIESAYGPGLASTPKTAELIKDLRRSWGVITLSRVGFDSEGTRAIVYAQLAYCGLCGEGVYLYLSKESGAWHVVRGSGTWIS